MMPNMGRFHFCSRGFTLIELMVVMLLITIMFAVTIPRIDGTMMQDPRKKTTRWLMNAVSTLRAAAIEKQKSQILVLNLDGNRLWTMDAEMDEEGQSTAAEKAFALPGGIRIVEVQFQGKTRVGSGNAEIIFYPGGYSDQAAINLENSAAERFAFKVEPLLPRIKVVEEWISY
ncbi:MAG: prepilin-type N-terminal cleavage/methylation domain-containing protein [Desulfatitalea sp.]